MSDFMSISPTEPRFLLVDASSPASSNRYYRRDMPSVMNESRVIQWSGAHTWKSSQSSCEFCSAVY